VNLDELKAAVESARRFSHKVLLYAEPPPKDDAPDTRLPTGSRTFQLRMPTSHEVKMAYARARTGTDDHLAAFFQSQREIAERSVTGWTEVDETDLVPDGANAPMAFDASLVPLIFDAHSDWQTSISEAIDKRIAEREGKQEAAAKN